MSDRLHDQVAGDVVALGSPDDADDLQGAVGAVNQMAGLPVRLAGREGPEVVPVDVEKPEAEHRPSVPRPLTPDDRLRLEMGLVRKPALLARFVDELAEIRDDHIRRELGMETA